MRSRTNPDGFQGQNLRLKSKVRSELVRPPSLRTSPRLLLWKTGSDWWLSWQQNPALGTGGSPHSHTRIIYSGRPVVSRGGSGRPLPPGRAADKQTVSYAPSDSRWAHLGRPLLFSLGDPLRVHHFSASCFISARRNHIKYQRQLIGGTFVKVINRSSSWSLVFILWFKEFGAVRFVYFM